MQTYISEFKLLMLVLMREVPSKGKRSSWIDPSVAEVGMHEPSLYDDGDGDNSDDDDEVDVVINNNYDDDIGAVGYR
jgi:hypothetical protein